MKREAPRALALSCALILLLAAGGCVVVIPMPADLAANLGEEKALASSPVPTLSPTQDPAQQTASISPESPVQSESPPAISATESPAAQGTSSPGALPPAVVAAVTGAQSDSQAVAEGLTSLSDQLYSFQVMLGGQVFSLPFAYSDLATQGWAPKEGLDLTLAPNQTAMEKVYKGDQEIYLRFVNTGTDVLSYQDCNVGGFLYTQSDGDTGTQLVLPGGITLGSSKAAVVEAYGNPTRDNVTDTLLFMDYRADSYAELSLQLDAQGDAVERIDIKNYFGDESDAPAPAVSAAPSIAVGRYQPPQALGDSWDTFTLRYAGALYRLPAPVQAFLDNGWVLQSHREDVVPAKRAAVGVELRLDNQVLSANVRNYDDTGQPVTSCYVTQVKSSVYGPDVTMELPGGIGMGSSVAQIQSAYGAPTKTDESSTFAYYAYGDVGERVEISFDTEKNIVSTLTVSHDPRELP